MRFEPPTVGDYPLAGGNDLCIRMVLIMRRNVCILGICVLGLTVLISAIGLFLVFSSFLVAGERIIVDGKISAIKDNSGNITAVNLIADGGDVFNIILDESGKKLGKQMDGKWVEVIGDVSVKGDKTWLEVKSYKKVEGEFK